MRIEIRKKNSGLCKALAGTLLLAMLVACATVPETDRKQVLLISKDQEVGLGLTEFDKIKKSTPISKDPQINQMVKRVGERVAAVSQLPDAKWEFVVFDEPDTANAFCLPGGKVGVFTGILPVTKNEAGLATVIGHEVAHAVARHGAERLSQGLLFQLGGQVLSQAMRTQTQVTQQLVTAAYGVGGQVGVLLPYSRKQELEADQLGLLYMARAGYNPQEAVEFWKRFSDYNAKKGGGSPPEFLSTHPIDDTRIAQLEKLMPEALREYQTAKAVK